MRARCCHLIVVASAFAIFPLLASELYLFNYVIDRTFGGFTWNVTVVVAWRDL